MGFLLFRFLGLINLLGLLNSLCLLFSIVDGNLDIVLLALNKDSRMIKFKKPYFVCIRDLFLNWRHVYDYLVYNCLDGLFYKIKVSLRSCKHDSIRINQDLSLIVVLKIHHELLIFEKFEIELLFLFSIFQGVKPDIFSFKLLKFSFLFEILSLNQNFCDLFEQ